MRYIIIVVVLLALFAQQPAPQSDPLPPTLPPIQTSLPVTPAPDRGPPPTMPPLSTDVPGTPLPDLGDPPVRPLHSSLYLPAIYT